MRIDTTHEDYYDKTDVRVKTRKKSEKGINNQRNNLYYIKQARKYTYIHTHMYTSVSSSESRRTRVSHGYF